MLREIAIEHNKGRRLLVVTTNLDGEEVVIWDMGRTATRDDPAALNLFKDVLVASASVPGVFPPMLLPGPQGGHATPEMHVDGGVNTPFLAIPESLMLCTRSSTTGARASVHVLINGKPGRSHGRDGEARSSVRHRLQDR